MPEMEEKFRAVLDEGFRATTDEELVEFAERLEEVLASEEGRQFVGIWIQTTAPEWAARGVKALATIVECCWLRKHPATVQLILIVLEEERSSELTRCVAAQRVRAVGNIPRDLRERIWSVLRPQLLKWEQTPQTQEYVYRVIPSVTALTGPEGMEFLRERILRGAPRLAAAALYGILDWVCGTSSYPKPISPEHVCEVAALVRTRIQNLREARHISSSDPNSEFEQDVLGGAIGWLLGCLATEQNAGEVAEEIVQVYLTGTDLERAGVVRGWRFFWRSHPEAAHRILQQSFARAGEEVQFHRFWQRVIQFQDAASPVSNG